MTLKTNIGLTEWVTGLVGNAYWYGTCVYSCSKSLLQSKSRQYPSHYKESRMKQYNADINAGKKCADCIGLVKGYYWTQDDGTMKYGLDGRPDKGANGMFTAAKVKGLISTLPETLGLLLYSPGHAGVYIGDGWVIEARGFAYGIVRTRVSERKWTRWYQCPYIDYLNGEYTTLIEKRESDQGISGSDQHASAELSFGERILRYVKGRKLMSGDDVVAIQTRLNELGFSPGAVDGLYGIKTETAVKTFQSSVGITIDGIVGPDTRAWLKLATTGN